jgi:TatA/E family protein of Tat protein translocase
MEFFGIGAPELMVILIIAIVMFGPDKIPTMAAQVGKTIRDFRRYTSELTKEFDDATGDLRKEFHNIAGDLRGELEATQADLRSQLDLTDVFKADTPKEAVAAGVATTSEPSLAALETATDGGGTATAVAEPAPPEPITVMTPYAESLAAREATEIATATPSVATKADPFADLVTLVVGAPAAEPGAIADAVAAPETIPDAAGSETTAPATNGHRKVVGGSVAGSKYSRRKSA